MNKIRIISLFFTLFCILSLFAGCAGDKSDFEIGKVENERVLIISVGTEGAGDAQVVVRRMAKIKDTDEYEVAEEYTPVNAEGKNRFAQVVEYDGVYEIEASCDGLENVIRTVNVNENRVYVVGLHMENPEAESETGN